jgi:hypothetical protein
MGAGRGKESAPSRTGRFNPVVAGTFGTCSADSGKFNEARPESLKRSMRLGPEPARDFHGMSVNP